MTAPRDSILALARSCHPGPSAVVTVVAMALALSAGATATTTLLVALAFGVGQLSVGWSNDWIDAERDAASGRRDKPVAMGATSRPLVGAAAVAALVVCVPASLALGPPAAAAHLAFVAAAWAYNLGLKSTVWSWLPYAVSFGLLPAVVTLALPLQHGPPWWLAASGALLGVGAHLVNVLPDLEDDRRTGVRGLPHRLGRRATGLLAPVLLVAASLLVVLGPTRPMGWVAGVGLLGAIVAAIVAAVSATRARHRLRPLVATAIVALIDVALLISAGATLSP